MTGEKLTLNDCIVLANKGIVPMDLIRIMNSLGNTADIQKFFNAYLEKTQSQVKTEKPHLSFHEAKQEAEEMVYTSIINALGSDDLTDYNCDQKWKLALPKLKGYTKSQYDAEDFEYLPFSNVYQKQNLNLEQCIELLKKESSKGEVPWSKMKPVFESLDSPFDIRMWYREAYDLIKESVTKSGELNDPKDIQQIAEELSCKSINITIDKESTDPRVHERWKKAIPDLEKYL